MTTWEARALAAERVAPEAIDWAWSLALIFPPPSTTSPTMRTRAGTNTTNMGVIEPRSSERRRWIQRLRRVMVSS